MTVIFVNDIAIECAIGVSENERRSRQLLLVDVELDIPAPVGDALADTIDYRHIVAIVERLAAGEPSQLIEAFAERIAGACLDAGPVRSLTVQVRKPQALAPAMAGVRISREGR